MRPAMKLLLASAVLLSCASCRTIATSTASPSAASVRVGTHARTWEVRSDGDVHGLVVLFQERGLARDSLYVVRNPWHQDLGMIDGLGRAFRYVPHLEEPVWVGSGTIAAGARAILGIAGECELNELAATARTSAEGSTEPLARPTDGPPPDGGLPQSR
jgi:hypothetical protein